MRHPQGHRPEREDLWSIRSPPTSQHPRGGRGGGGQSSYHQRMEAGVKGNYLRRGVSPGTGLPHG